MLFNVNPIKNQPVGRPTGREIVGGARGGAIAPGAGASPHVNGAFWGARVRGPQNKIDCFIRDRVRQEEKFIDFHGCASMSR